MTEQIKGRIHSVETFGTVDGPGIRFIVFMQGCPLRCIYCHNRDTWDAKGGKEVTVDQILEELQGYMEFIKFSGGGITVTGGEPTLQAKFVTELFKRCKEIGVHTALDTSGFVDIDKVEELLSYTDLILLDIKQAINEKHKVITGVSNSKIQTFARHVSDKGIPIWIRYVLVPGYTDGQDDLTAAADFIGQLNHVEKIDVLPYHSMGEYKWDNLGEKYILHGVESPGAEQVENAKKILESKMKKDSK
ncbi:pyruvate formate-lyase-activating protein [Petroclostridium sp. X23]|uniref:pyruvate formate-lyase-activating protein n=1 Tax=Petroclostridium sp. X23 TaxID=3045146 RepID=UPI0024AD9479|nr:pyruvate formate-lyase-activating protein [Petroclostridium sp. X23]WHH60558.1 pyruvate formate-lyase-activating protein [Petroclostridium sp. X23]